jgi:hypothetical protein
MRPLATVLSFSLCATLGAQVWSPAHFTNSRAAGSNVFPFGTGTTFRYAQIHDDITSPIPVMKLSTRRTQSTTALAQGSATVDLWLSTAATSSATPNLTFDNNHGADKTQVITSKMVNMAQATPDSLPGQFDVSLPFDMVFPFTGQGSLCWEVHVTNRVGSFTHDNVSGVNANPPLATHNLTAFRPGCKATNRTTNMGATGTSVMTWASGTGILRVTGSNALDSGLVVTVVGANGTTWGGIPLPFLIPGSDTAPSGPCNLYTDVILLQVTVASIAGATTTDVAVPATPDLNGLTTRSQNWCFDAMANPIGIVTSNVVLHNFIAPYPTTQPLCRIYLSGSLGAVASGSQVGGGNVTQFN